MARPAERAKQYSRATDTAGILAVERTGIVTGTTRCSPSRPVSRSVAGQAFALSATATCVDATKLTLSVPHSSCAGPGRSGPEVYTSHRPELAPDETTCNGGGVVTLSVLVSGCGPVSRTSRLVRPPAGTGTRIVPPLADQRPVCPPTRPDTASWLRASTCRPAGPAEAARHEGHDLHQHQHDRDDRDAPAPFPRLHTTIFVSSPENPAQVDAAIASCRRLIGRRRLVAACSAQVRLVSSGICRRHEQSGWGACSTGRHHSTSSSAERQNAPGWRR